MTVDRNVLEDISARKCTLRAVVDCSRPQATDIVDWTDNFYAVQMAGLDYGEH